MPTSKLAFFLITALFLLTSPALALETGSVTGHVTDDRDQPLDFVAVQILDQAGGSMGGAMTNAEGMFSIQNVPRGIYTLKASLMGYEVDRRSITVSPGPPLSIRLSLKEKVVGEFVIDVVA